MERKAGEVIVEARTGDGYVDLCLRHRRKREAVLIELKSSEKKKGMKRDADKALEQIVERNHRNPEALPNIGTLREYGIAACHLNSRVKGRYLELNGDQWVETGDPATSLS